MPRCDPLALGNRWTRLGFSARSRPRPAPAPVFDLHPVPLRRFVATMTAADGRPGVLFGAPTGVSRDDAL